MMLNIFCALHLVLRKKYIYIGKATAMDRFQFYSVIVYVRKNM